MPKKSLQTIGVLTGGGDCPGLNAVVRAVVKTAIVDYGLSAIGIQDGYAGLVGNRMRKLEYEDVSGILAQGGTILGTSNRADPFNYIEMIGGKRVIADRSDQAVANFEKRGIDALVCIGGDGTMSIAARLMEKGIPLVGVPKTIDNDLYGTDISFGFDSAVQIISDAVDRLHSTAESHHRVMVVETMGRYAGWLALHGGVAGGGDIILIPEIPYSMEAVIDRVRERSRRGKRFSIVVVAEGVKLPDGGHVVKHRDQSSHDPIRLGGIGIWLAREIERLSGIAARATVLGYLQRGGSPTAYDRILATRFGREAMKLVSEGCFGFLVGLQGTEIMPTALEDIADRQRLVNPDCHLVSVARSVGTSFGGGVKNRA